MALTIGGRLGVYEVRELIGAGGMGEVYRGHDPRLNRSVALKILPDAFARDPDRLARFKREAHLLASLNHSNIGAIFGFEDSDGVHALVLELVEGPTLADRIAQGSLSLEDALPIARQITDALEAAHSQGIVHRDLKPANIKVRPDGTVKVLDFGLAKAVAGDVATGSVTQSPTMTSPAYTQMGIILGTAAYMSPEQARGRPADQRSDIWAFGAVLYEMLTGKRVFDGDDMSYTLANILKSEPDWTALPADTPFSIRRVLRRCLEKDPRRRIHDIADARLDLDETEPVAGTPALPQKRRLLNAERLAWAFLATLLAGALAYIVLRTPPPPAAVRFHVDPPENYSFGTGGGTSGATLSPDGTQLVFVAIGKSGVTQLWLRRLDSFTSRQLTGTDYAASPCWSPDSRSIAFFAAGKLKQIDTTTGSIQTISDAPGIPRGATWGSGDVIVFSAGSPGHLARISARGGEITPIAGPGGTMARYPSFLPDGRHFLYVGRLPSSKTALELILDSIEPGFEARALFPSESSAAFVPPGSLLFVRGERLVQQAFDLNRLKVAGEPTPVVEQVSTYPGTGAADFTVSATGVLAFRSSSNRSSQFAWFDRAGKPLETVGAPGHYRTPHLSPDGQRLAFADVNQRDIYILDLSRRTSSRFTSGSGSETSPVWFPDGTKIAYRHDEGGLFEKDVNGTGPERRLLEEIVAGPTQVSPDGKWILYFTSGGNPGVYVVSTTGDGKPQLVVPPPFGGVEPQLSQDGRWLAYASNENTGRPEVYVQAFPSTGKRWPVSNNGGRQPLWRDDGKELYFVSDDRKFYAVAVSESSGSLVLGIPEFLFDMRANVSFARNSYIPSHDGKRFLVNMLLDADDAPINVVYNWRTTLK